MDDINDKLSPDPARLRALADDLDADGLRDLAEIARRVAAECDGPDRVDHPRGDSKGSPRAAPSPSGP